LELPASELPEIILSHFALRPAGNVRFSITVEPVQSDEQRLVDLRRTLQAGIDDSNAGRIFDGAAVFTELKSRFEIT